MKVKELIERLKMYDENTEVCIEYREVDVYQSEIISEYNSVSVVKKKNDIYYDSNGNECRGLFVSLVN
jgi:hypothetical protein